MTEFSRKGAEGVTFAARTGNDWSKGRRGMAKDVRGAKKYIRTRIRFHDKADLRLRVAEETKGD